MESLKGITQREVSYKIDQHHHQLLSDHFTREGAQRESARLLSLGLPHAGDWLTVVPSPSLGLHLRPMEFVTVVKYRLGCFLYTRAGKCPACPNNSDRLGDHAMCCAYEGERIARHNALRDALYRTAVSAALAPTKEGRFLLPGGDRRPADVLIPHWTGGRDTALDVTVVHPLQSAMVVQAAVTPGYALQEAYKGKMQKPGEDCRRQGLAFLPMAGVVGRLA